MSHPNSPDNVLASLSSSSPQGNVLNSYVFLVLALLSSRDASESGRRPADECVFQVAEAVGVDSLAFKHFAEMLSTLSRKQAQGRA